MEGRIKIADSDRSPEAGTIRWTGTDFLGWNGTKWISLTYSGIAFEGQVTGYDGNLYQTVKIDDQEWMVQNLRTTHYGDGTSIANSNDSSEWISINYGAWCWYDTADNYDLPYGKLYNW